jgi:hypothetical protein
MARKVHPPTPDEPTNAELDTQANEAHAQKANKRRIDIATAQVDGALERLKEREKESATQAVGERVSTLSVMERRYLINYLSGMTQVESAADAGYKHPEKQGWRLAHSLKIRAAIDEILTAQEMPKLKVIARLSQHAEAAYAPYLKVERGRVSVDLDALIADGLGHLIKGIKETRWGQVVEFYDAQTALVQMGRYHGLFTDNVNQSGEVSLKVKEPASTKLTRLTQLLSKAKQRQHAAAEQPNEETS